jgi:hypothetical protein
MGKCQSVFLMTKGRAVRLGPSHVCGHRLLSLYRVFSLRRAVRQRKPVLMCWKYLPGGLGGGERSQRPLTAAPDWPPANYCLEPFRIEEL